MSGSGGRSGWAPGRPHTAESDRLLCRVRSRAGHPQTSGLGLGLGSNSRRDGPSRTTKVVAHACHVAITQMLLDPGNELVRTPTGYGLLSFSSIPGRTSSAQLSSTTMACYVGKEGWNTGDVKWGKHLSSESSWSSGIIIYYYYSRPERERKNTPSNPCPYD